MNTALQTRPIALEPQNPGPRDRRSIELANGATVTFSAPLETLTRGEIQRTRRYCYMSFTMALSLAACVPWLGGDPTVTRLLLGSLTATVPAAAFLLYQTRDPARFRRPTTLLARFVMLACTTMIIPYFGAFSAAPLVFVLAIYFTGLGKSTRMAFVVYAMSAGAEALTTLIVVTGITRDTGLIHPTYLDARQQLLLQVLIQLIFAITLFTARTSRQTQLAAIEELEREVRISAHREALLIEAREQLDRVLRPGRGRFSDQQIGAYLLGALIGRGSMGEVYEAYGPNGRVAIKLMSQASLGHTGHVLRFLRELRTAAAVQAPNVVKVLEVGEHPVPYLVMERLVGASLAEILCSEHALTHAEIVELIRQVGAGITAAGAAGIVHRDLKPQNVFRDGRTWKILDFGVARALEQGDTLSAGQLVGTPQYMAPEQASGDPVGHATDLYELAGIAYRALTGHPPFTATHVADLVHRIVHTSPRRPSDLAVDLPSQVDLVLAIGLAKQPADRFATADELTDALETALAGRLAPQIRHRGLALVQAGAWAGTR